MGVWPFGYFRIARLGSRLASAALIGLLAAGCQGGGTAGPLVTPAGPGIPPKAPATASVTFTMRWPAATTFRRRPAASRLP
jgi:hypothetical protein